MPLSFDRVLDSIADWIQNRTHYGVPDHSVADRDLADARALWGPHVRRLTESLRWDLVANARNRPAFVWVLLGNRYAHAKPDAIDPDERHRSLVHLCLDGDGVILANRLIGAGVNYGWPPPSGPPRWYDGVYFEGERALVPLESRLDPETGAIQLATEQDDWKSVYVFVEWVD